MQCATCGSVDLTEGGACRTCGTLVAVTCSVCGTVGSATARFCAHCGRPATHDAAVGPFALSFLRSKVPPDMVDRILRSGNSMIGERKRVTVLFADIRGSTALINALDPEEAIEAIAPIIQILMDVVHAHNGFVNQTRGDGIMALFGAPLANEDHALQACQAALAMHRDVDEHARQTGEQRKLRIGLNSGEVVVQSIGSDLSMNYDAVGRTVHLAARMEHLARPGTVLLTEDTFALVKGFVQATALGKLNIDGVNAPVSAYELTSAAPVTRWQARKSLGLTRFTGRARDLETLQATLAAVEHGAGRVITITGEPGLGKSRLVHEFLLGVPASWIVFQTACSSQRTHSSYHPFTSLLHASLGIAASDSPEEMKARLFAGLAKSDPGLEPYAAVYLSLLDVRTADASWAKLEPGERRRKVVELAHVALLRRSKVAPVLVVIEDLHWCDPETRFIIDHLVTSLEGARVLMLITQRPGATPPLPERARMTRIALEPLDDDAAARMVDQLLGRDISLTILKRHILQQAQGNPLYIEEMVQDLKGNASLQGAPGDYRLAALPSPPKLPGSIHAVIAARIDQLEREPRTLLQTAAVIGRDVPVLVLARMQDATPGQLAAPLAALEDADLLYPAEGSAGAAYTFKHELIREVAYQTLMLSRRRDLHAKAVDIIEAAFADRLDEHIDRLADHAYEARLWAKALPYQMRSCRRALRRGSNHEAVAICERAAATLAKVPEGPERTKAQIDFSLIAIIALEPLGRHQRIAGILREASEQAAALNDAWRIAAVNCQLVVALWRIGEHEAAMRAAVAAEKAASAIGDAALMFAARHNLGIVHHETGNFAEAIAAHRACIAMETPEIDAKRVGWAALPSVVLRTFLADSLLEMGEIGEADAIAEAASKRATAADHPYSRVQINQVRARIRLAQGRASDALALLANDWRTSIELDMVQMQPIVATRLGQAHLAQGNVAAALEILAQPDRLDVPLAENAFGWRYLFLTRGHAYLADGQIEMALTCAHRALALAIERAERPQQAYAHALLGEIFLRDRGGRSSAEQHLRQAMQLAGGCGMRPLVRHCRSLLSQQSRWLGFLRRFASPDQPASR